ncbi:MAG: hypothetical protein CFH15_00953 [Alphaproteobacteria bacterium MarineAlpha5_Bin5]|nr:MAG: hypothetical protein CFH15_00953 [Alphaproteobacteria bacterium MarineAlpha5_Bin5]PPR52303.1 MAG: hypothetical protein CFH14_00434 [Alphaproteobacteria bacterium MarineAlpha5_Bin4]|tara:strand:- start:3648 stop:4031 length:384 start_codon:yes stop_codon:yes gene_type:complete
MNNKQYYNIKEVSKILNIKEHVIRHWDSVDPKTKKVRIEGLSVGRGAGKRLKNGTRYFSQKNINKLKKLKETLFDEEFSNKRIYSLKLANKIVSNNKSKINLKKIDKKKYDSKDLIMILNNLKEILD